MTCCFIIKTMLSHVFKSFIMQTVLVIIATCLASATFAQKNNDFHQNISDDGKKLSIKINATKDGKSINYNRTFDVSGMNQSQREALTHRVFDSLGIDVPVAPVPPIPPVEPAAPLAPFPPIEPVAPVAPVEFNTDVAVVSSKDQYTESYIVGGNHPYTKEIKYNPSSGILYMKYRFVKKGEQVTYEKSVDAKNKSQEEKQNIITKYESEIGLYALKPQ